MKKLVFSIQVFIVTLLAVQLTSCEGFPGPEPISEQYARHDERLVLHSGRNDRLASRRYQSERFRRRRRSVPHAQQRQQRGDQIHIQPIVLRMDRGLSGMEHEYGLLPLGALPME